MSERPQRILVVGTHGSGKTTLVAGLQAAGWDASSFALEHSTTPRIWRRRQPDILIALYCSYETLVRRRGITWPKERWRRQLYQLGDAWAHADLRVQTDRLTPEGLVADALRWLDEWFEAAEAPDVERRTV